MLGMLRESEAAQEVEEESESSSGAGAPNVELPSPQAVVNELEEFLRQLRREDNGNGE